MKLQGQFHFHLFHSSPPGPIGIEEDRGRGAIQSNDVDLDYRGFIYITDRAGNGMLVLEFTEGK